ncbi:MAG: isoprenyl transferase [Sumerlaeia bacterium]
MGNLPETLKRSDAPVLLEPCTARESELFAHLAPSRMPAHVAIIMDGNGRWASQRSFPERIEGHRAGIDSVRAAACTGAQLKLKALTLYAFSKENWKRPQREINALMHLLETFLVKEIPELNDNNIRLATSGEIEDLPLSTRKKLDHTLQVTAGNDGMVLNLALSYGGRNEITLAARRAAEDVAAGRLTPEQITQDVLASYMYTAPWGDPELLIRTSGELRVSNFLLWQIAYTEFVYMPVLWPDFRREHFLEALVEYQSRDRRFGKVR